MKYAQIAISNTSERAIDVDMLDLPNWVEGRRITILAGMEEVAHKIPGKPWEIKIKRCTNCGKCCRNCEYLEDYPVDKKICGLAKKRGIPYHCLVGDGWLQECNITWRNLE